ncbi:MAG TPA: hypothetical protein VLT84_13020, partial [Acidobacteriota bacterium]|nr:hypothetical protein [Acidobacteriota bacterium]
GTAGAVTSPQSAAAEPSAAARRDSLREVFDAFRAVAQRRGDGFTVDEQDGVLEIAPVTPDGGAAARCRMKVFRPRENRDRLCAFFYKRSNLGWSRDRFSYGAIEFLPETLTREDAAAWLAWLQGGFDPDSRPARLRRAFLYTIPG